LSKGRIRRKTYEITSSDSRSLRLAGFGGRLSGRDRERTHGVKTLFGFGPKIEGSVADRPDGLLLHENIFYSLFPLHFGMRQYWRDFESLERFTRAEPHREWWKQFCETLVGLVFGTNFILHEAVLKRSTSISSDPLAFFVLPKRYLRKGCVFSARERLHRDGAADTPPTYTETDL
jgi:Domain of unknown function (DUF4188)